MANLIRAIQTISNSSVGDVIGFYKSKSKNRINAVGEALEAFVKDAFADTLHENDASKKNEIYEKTFSYFGNQNNPPDLMIRGGDALEIKKIESQSAQIALNSSYPSAKLFANSTMLTASCRSCERWDERDIIYAIGSSPKKEKKLTLLWFVYGDCYAASKEIYERTRSKVINVFNSIPGLEFVSTNELGRINRVDPLGITHLRVRGMWIIEHPSKAYNYLNIPPRESLAIQVFALMKESKYLSFPESDRESLESMSSSNLSIKNVKIKSPDNPAQLLEAKLITYQN